MNKKVLLGFLFIVILLLTAGFYFKLQKEPKKTALPKNVLPTNTTSYPVQKQIESFDWKVPEISNDYKWKIEKITKSDSNFYNVYWDNRFASTNNNQNGSVDFNGTLYSVDFSDNNPSNSGNTQFLSNLDSQLNNSGWLQTITYANWYLIGAAADGVFGSKTGYIKMNGTKINTVIHSYNKEVTKWDGPGSEVVCPCTNHIEVFVGEQEELSGQIPNLVKQ